MSSTPSHGEDVVCPVCRLPNHVRRWKLDSGDFYRYSCGRCGDFAIGRDDQNDFLDNNQRREESRPAQLSALLREQFISNPLPFWIRFTDCACEPVTRAEYSAIHVSELLTRWPRTVSERLDHVLCNIARMSRTGGDSVSFSIADESAFGILFASSVDEAKYHLRALQELGRLTGGRTPPQSIRHATTSLTGVVVTPAGWDRFDQITRGSSSPVNPVFVAMWFGKSKETPQVDRSAEMLRMYQEGIEPAVIEAGYLVRRADQVEHVEDIMDRVLGDIRVAPFVVADFTGNCSGVYYEAGFARGLRVPVIHTCQKAELRSVHFDVNHIRTICWDAAADLKRQLLNTIRGVIGEGPYIRKTVLASASGG